MCIKEDAMKKVKKTRRSKAKYPALDPEFNLKMRKDLIDYDYLNKLNPAELKWLNSFTEEYTNADFNHKDTRVHDKIIKVKHIKYKKKDKNVDVYKSDSYKRNNDRNNDIYTRMSASGKLVDLDSASNSRDNSFEDRLIEKLDAKNRGDSDETVD